MAQWVSFGSVVTVIDSYDMTMNIVVPEMQLNGLRLYAVLNLDILVRPVGVWFKLIVISSDHPFGWANNSQTFGFNEGKFTRLIIMPIIKKPDYTIFASEAKKGELSDFPNLLRGWGVTIDQTAGKPPMEWFNTLQKRTDEWLTYLSQRGISEWDNTLDYPKNAVVQSEGKFYVSLRENNARAPNKSQSDWQPMADALNIKIEDATLKNKGMVQLSSATDSDSETMAATPKAVKAAYDMAASPAVKSVNGKKGEVILTPDDIGAFSNAGGTVKGEIISQGGQISLKGDNRKHLGFHNQDGSVRMWLYKDKGGDGVRLHNGDDGGGEYVFHKDGGFRAPSSVYAGAARIAADGNIYGSMWGNQWLDAYLRKTFQPKGAGQAYTKEESDTRYVRDVQRGSATFPPKINAYGPAEAPVGCVLTRAWHDPGDAYGVFFTYRPLQIYINGAWRTISDIADSK